MANSRVIQVIETTTICGHGTENSPVRQIVEYFTLDGDRLVKLDPVPDADDHIDVPGIEYALKATEGALLMVSRENLELKDALKRGNCNES